MGSFTIVLSFLALGFANSVLAIENEVATEMAPIPPKPRSYRNIPRTISPVPPHSCPGRFRASSPDFTKPYPQPQSRPTMTDAEYLQLILPLGIDLDESIESNETPSNSPVSRQSSSDCEAPSAPEMALVPGKKIRKSSNKSLTKPLNKSLDKMQIMLPVLIPFLMAMGTLFTVYFLQHLSQL